MLCLRWLINSRGIEKLTWLRLIVAVEELREHWRELGPYDSRIHATLSVEVMRRLIRPVHPLFSHVHVFHLQHGSLQ